MGALSTEFGPTTLTSLTIFPPPPSPLPVNSSALDSFPTVSSFFGVVELKYAMYMIAAVCMVQPLFYGCTLFMPLSYHLVTMWSVIFLFSGLSCLLLAGVMQNDSFFLRLWIWFAIIYILVMLMLMILLAMVLITRKQAGRVVFVFIAALWYLMTIYFVIVVNSYRQQLVNRTHHGSIVKLTGAGMELYPSRHITDPPVGRRSYKYTSVFSKPSIITTPEMQKPMIKSVNYEDLLTDSSTTSASHSGRVDWVVVHRKKKKRGLTRE